MCVARETISVMTETFELDKLAKPGLSFVFEARTMLKP